MKRHLDRLVIEQATEDLVGETAAQERNASFWCLPSPCAVPRTHDR